MYVPYIVHVVVIYVSLIKPGNISTEMNCFGESSALIVAKDVEHAISSSHPKPRVLPRES